jgi:hypothetical protein
MSKWEEWKSSLGETKPWHLLDPNQYVQDENISIQRLSICHGCPEFIKTTNQCKKCGCIMSLKSKLEKATCPLGKW